LFERVWEVIYELVKTDAKSEGEKGIREDIFDGVIEFGAKNQVREGGRESFDGLVEIQSECKVGEKGREVIYRRIKPHPESEVCERRREVMYSLGKGIAKGYTLD
jgi:hypothetical protein